MNILKKNKSNHNKTISINDKSLKNNIDTMSNNHSSSNNNNYAEIALLSDLNSSNSKKKISNIIQSNPNNISYDNNSNHIISTNNHIIFKPKINISFVNNINTFSTHKINKSRNKNNDDKNSNLNISIKKGLLNDIFKTTNSLNKKPSNTPNKNKLVKNVGSNKQNNINTSMNNKLSRNIPIDKGLKNSVNLTEHYVNLKKNINLMKHKNNPQNNYLQKMSLDLGKIKVYKPNKNTLSINKNQIKSHNRSFFK